MRGKRVRAGRGLPMTTAPLAYTSIRNEFGKSTGYEFREELRSWFDELARLFLMHESYRAMALALGVNPMTGTPIQGRTVQYIVESPFYRGLVGSNGRAAPGRQAPVWDAATCAAIGREIERRRELRHNTPRRRASRGPAPLALLDGVLRCGLCGHVLSKRRNQARRPEAPGTRSYFCARSHEARQRARALGLPPDD